MLDIERYQTKEDNFVSNILIGILVMGSLIAMMINPVVILVVAFIAFVVWVMFNTPPAISCSKETKEETVSNNIYGSNYYQYRIDCTIKGFAQSKKFVYATCVNEASALAKSDPSIERILAIYRV